jgi:hypothetical protein
MVGRQTTDKTSRPENRFAHEFKVFLNLRLETQLAANRDRISRVFRLVFRWT